MAYSHYPDDIEYSEKYSDDTYEYRHVIMTKSMTQEMFMTFFRDGRTNLGPRLLDEEEWRSLGVCQSLGWVHYAIHPPEPHILLFRRPLGTNPENGRMETDSNKVLTVHHSKFKKDDRPYLHIWCTGSIAGEEVTRFDIKSDVSTWDAHEHIGQTIGFPAEKLKLLLPSGECMQASPMRLSCVQKLVDLLECASLTTYALAI